MIFSVQQAPTQLKGELGRAKHEVGIIKEDMKGVKGQAQKAQGAAKGASLPKKKMGFFAKKTACEGCGQKLHPSWDECPYCGFKKGTAAVTAPAGGGAAAGGAPQRTVALDLSAGAMPGSGILGWLIPLEGSRAGELIELRGRVTVGKSPDNNVVFNESAISGRHCEFVGSATGFVLNDLGSTNGTFVNEKRIQSHELVDNDNVRLGKVRFKFKSLN